MQNSRRLRIYFGAIYLKFYKMPGAVAFPFVVVGVMKGAASTLDFFILGALYLVVLVSAASDDEAAVTRTLRGLATSRTPHARRNETIFYALAFVVYNLMFILHRGVFQQFDLVAYLLGAALSVAIYFLRPGSFRLR